MFTEHTSKKHCSVAALAINYSEVQMPRAEAIATFSFEDGRRPLPELISSLISKLKEIYKLRNIETEQSIELEKGMGTKPDWLPIFFKKGHFLALNGHKDRKYFAQSCPQGWKRLTRKFFNCGTKLTNVVLKVWDNKWDCGGYTTPSRILRRLYEEKIIKNHQNCKYTKISPAMPTNQLTCTTNMILSHYMHRLWGLQRSKVLKSILHCSWEIFISPGSSLRPDDSISLIRKKQEITWFSTLGGMFIKFCLCLGRTVGQQKTRSRLIFQPWCVHSSSVQAASEGIRSCGQDTQVANPVLKDPLSLPDHKTYTLIFTNKFRCQINRTSRCFVWKN